MSVIARLLGRNRDEMRGAYAAVVALARDPLWYRNGGVPDTMDGRFNMVTLIMALVLARLEDIGGDGRADATYLTERFIDDMDAQLREIGIGDLVVGKQVGKMMSALGGRLEAYAGALDGAHLGPALDRNLWNGAPPVEAVRNTTIAGVRKIAGGLAGLDRAAIADGRLPKP